jgi:penicillin-binding protein 1C
VDGAAVTLWSSHRTVSIGALLACTLLFVAAGLRAEPATFAQVRAGFVSSDAQLLDRNGEPLQRLRVDKTGRRLQWVALDDISPALLRATIAAEDRRFHEHRGVDWRALGAAAWQNLFTNKPRGASTISMQLAGLLDPRLQGGAGGRKLLEKWRQMQAARELETRWSKAQVLEAYLNLVSYRGELQGIDAAAQGLYGKAPSGLNNVEALVLAALIRAPAAAPALLGRRACALGSALQWSGRCADIEWSAQQALNRARVPPAAGIAPRVAEKLLPPAARAAPTRTVTSTLDAGLQRFVVAELRQQLAGLRGHNVNDGAVLVLDNATGEVLAYVANGGNSAVDGVAAPRQAGSTLKPFLYQLAIENRQLTAASLLDDSPLDIATPAGLYVPQNYDRTFNGLASVRTGLGNSLNVPAVRTLLLSGIEPFYARLHDLGFSGLTELADHYGYSLALGGADVSLLELTNAYRALANGGTWSPVVLQIDAARVEPRPVMDAAAAYIVADILSDNAARNLTFGLDSALATPFWSAAKTGTSKDMRDNWCVGFSGRFTVGVWVGNFDGQPMWDVSGVTGAAPVWRQVMEHLHATLPSTAPPAPAGLVAQQVAFAPALEGERREWFLAGTESRTVEALGGTGQPPRIQYPGNGVVIALDPDIPLDHQRVAFQARAGANLFWQLDGVLLATADRALPWRPRAGRHTLQLVDGDDVVRDAVRFEVRGRVESEGLRPG